MMGGLKDKDFGQTEDDINVDLGKELGLNGGESNLEELENTTTRMQDEEGGDKNDDTQKNKQMNPPDNRNPPMLNPAKYPMVPLSQPPPGSLIDSQ